MDEPEIICGCDIPRRLERLRPDRCSACFGITPKRMTDSKIWTVVSVVRHDNGETTLTLRDEHGTTMTDTYPPRVTVNKVV